MHALLRLPYPITFPISQQPALLRLDGDARLQPSRYVEVSAVLLNCRDCDRSEMNTTEEEGREAQGQNRWLQEKGRGRVTPRMDDEEEHVGCHVETRRRSGSWG